MTSAEALDQLVGLHLGVGPQGELYAVASPPELVQHQFEAPRRLLVCEDEYDVHGPSTERTGADSGPPG
jgi:hypothetical protein